MTIKELRDNIGKIDDENLEGLLMDIFQYGKDYVYYFSDSLDKIDITDYIPIPYEVCEENEE